MRALLAAVVFTAAALPRAHAQNTTPNGGTGFTLVTNNGSAPYQFTGLLAAQGSNALLPIWSTYNIGAGTVAADPRLVHTLMALAYNPAAKSPFTNKNYFILKYDNVSAPAANTGVLLRSYVQNTGYAALVTQYGLFSVDSIAGAYTVFYATKRLAPGTPYPVGGGNFTTTSKLVMAGYSGVDDYRLYTTGLITGNIAGGLGINFSVIPNIVPAGNLQGAICPFIGAPVFSPAGKSFELQAIGLIYDSIPTGTGGVASGTAIILVDNSATIINEALKALNTGSGKGPAQPGLNANSLFVVATEGINHKSINLQVKNTGGGTLLYTVSSSVDWMKPTPTSGILRTGVAVVTLNFSTKKLALGYTSGVLGVFNRVGARSMSVTVEVVPNRPAPPKNVTATKNRTDGVLVSWHPVTGVDSYDVLRGQNASGKNLTTLGTTEHNVFLDTHASPGVTYYYYVESVGTKYNSVLSRSAAGEVKE